MSTSPYVPFYTSDFLAGTSGMTAATKGVYITLISLIYEAEKPLAQSWDTLARRCGCTLPAFKKAVASLEDDGKVTLTEAGIWSDKCEKHIAQRRERQGSAKAAAETRWEKIKQNQGRDDATASIPQCQPEPEPEPYKKEEPKGSLSSGDDVAVAFDAYNRLAEEIGLPVARVLSKTRRSSLRARLAEAGGIDGWHCALEKARASPLCNGSNERGWKADLDFLLQQKSFTRLMEGSYDNRNHNTARPANGPAHRPDAALEQIARLAGIGPASGNGGG